jgi:DNA-binding transcriptional LysR family regulator
MELRHLRYFTAVAEELNFRRAATRLNMTQPSLSAQIRQLEDLVGAQLLERDTHRVSLTPAGARFLEDSRRILRDAGDSIRTASRIARGETGQLAIGFVASLGHGLFPRVLRAFRKRFPDVDLRLSEMDTTQQIEALAAHRLDLGFIGLGLPKDTATDLELALVAKEKLVAAIPEDHRLATHSRTGRHPAAIRLRSLAGERLLLTARQNAPIYNPWIVTLCQQAGFHPHDVQEAGQPVTVLNYVAAGLGVTILPAQFSRVPTAGVRFAPLTRPSPVYSYYVAWRRENSGSALQNFINSALRTAGKASRARAAR